MEWLKERTCRYCGRTFKTAFGRQRYCSDECWFRMKAARRKPPKFPPWSHEEIKMLRELAGTMPARMIAERIGRNFAATRVKARQLRIGLTCYGEHCSWAKYSNALVEEARSLHDEGIGATEIAKRLGVPLSSIEDYIYYRRRLGPLIEYYF